MGNAPDFGRLLWRASLALLASACLVLLCYLFVDRPVARYVYDQRFADHPALKWLTYPPPILQAWVPVVLAALMIRRVRGPFLLWEWTLLATCVSMVLADQFRESMAFVFGRTWPETWVDDNPSFIRDGAFGFHPFHGGKAYDSFPSGHTARTLAVAAVVWIAYPGWRWASGVASVAMTLSLLGMDYHFVSDIVGGAFVGGIMGMYLAHLCGLAELQVSQG